MSSYVILALLACCLARTAEAADCDGDAATSVSDIVVGIHISFGERPLTSCPDFDIDGDGNVVVSELVFAISELLEPLPHAVVFDAAKYPIGPVNAAQLVDLDRDGYLDMVGVQQISRQIVIRSGAAGSVFKPAATTVVSDVPGPVDLAIEDLDGDGRLDIVTANGGADSVSVVFSPTNVGEGQIHELRVTPGVSSQPRFVGVGDFNADDVLDVASANVYSRDVTVFLGQGNRTFAGPQRYPTGAGTIRGFAIADVNGDGFDDVVCGDAGAGKVLVLPGAQDGKLRSPQQSVVGASIYKLKAAHFDADGSIDLLAVNLLENRLTILTGNGSGSFLRTFEIPTGSFTRDAIVSDVNGDSRPDIVAAFGSIGDASAGSIIVAVGRGDGSFDAQERFQIGGEALTVASGDVNRDGRTDLIAGGGAILLGQGNGLFDVAYTFGAPSCALAVSDIDLDQNPDVVIVTEDSTSLTSSLHVYRGDGQGSFAFEAESDLPENSRNSPDGEGLLVRDLGGDAIPEIITANFNDQSISVLRAIDGWRSASSQRFEAGGSWSVQVGDFNEDGILDIAQNGGWFLFGQGGLSFGPPALLTSGGAGNQFLVMVGDFDRDGHADAAYPGARLDVAFGDGEGRLAATQSISNVGSGRGALGDVNGDGTPDFVIGSAANGPGTVTVLLSLEDRSFSEPQTYSTAGRGPTAVSLVDVNGDQTLDIVASNRSSSDFAVLLGRRGGRFVSPRLFAAGSEPVVAAVGDVNHDGVVDIITGNATSEIGVHLGKRLSNDTP